jgi:hypothetical protein
MGILMPKTCWAKEHRINLICIASSWFFTLRYLSIESYSKSQKYKTARESKQIRLMLQLTGITQINQPTRISHKIMYHPHTWTLLHVAVIIHHLQREISAKEHKINSFNFHTHVHVGEFMYMDGLWFYISCVHLRVYVGDYSHSELNK